jgi:hypothetical protein
MRFNHVAQRVTNARYELVLDMLRERLGFVLLRRSDRSAWLRQPGTNVDLQLSRSDTANRDADKRRSQVSFLSDTPRADLEALAEWLRAQGAAPEVGAYSDREFWLDIPDGFVDFVIEAMLPELADYGVDV